MHRSALFVVMATGAVLAQSGPAFDVASIKRNRTADSSSSFGYPPGRFLARNLSMRGIIAMVYGDSGFPTDRVIGGPGWLDSDKYDVEGKISGADVPVETFRAMARSLMETFAQGARRTASIDSIARPREN